MTPVEIVRYACAGIAGSVLNVWLHAIEPGVCLTLALIAIMLRAQTDQH